MKTVLTSSTLCKPKWSSNSFLCADEMSECARYKNIFLQAVDVFSGTVASSLYFLPCIKKHSVCIIRHYIYYKTIQLYEDANGYKVIGNYQSVVNRVLVPRIMLHLYNRRK